MATEATEGPGREGEMSTKEKIAIQVTVEVVVRTSVGELTRSEATIHLTGKEAGGVINQHVVHALSQAVAGAEAVWKA